MTDLELLHQYTADRSRGSLEELIRRHAPWVHAVATRRVGDAHLAQDVMQAVFLVLATKPPKITSGSGLAGWLFGVTCNAANQALRGETHRRKRERAFAMEHQEASQSDELMQKQWEELQPHLDLAVQSLGVEDRSAVLLRFYQQMGYGDVATALGVSEDAARKRVSRAVAKLRDVLTRRGVTVPSVALFSGLLETSLVPPVSAAVVQTALAVVSGAAAAQASVIAKGVMVMIVWTKTKVAIAATVVLVLLGAGTGIAVKLAGEQSQVRPVPSPQPTGENTFTGTFTVIAQAPPAADPNWRARFDAVYHLADGEVLKRIAPPFIPERMDWYRITREGQAQAIPRGPEYMTFHWDGKLKHWGMGFGFDDGQTISDILGSTLRLKTYEFDGPADLLKHKLTGDFIIRADAKMEDQLDALCRIVRMDGGPVMRFTLQKLERPTIVASGQYKFTPLQGAYSNRSVHMFVEKLDSNEGSGGGSGDLESFLTALGSRVGLPVSNEVTGERPQMISWGHHQSSRLYQQPPGAQKEAAVRKLLDGLAPQTGLQFKIEQRQVQVWVAEASDPRNGL
jgi:RNA polymerase sigma factor (sigma-70 family)